MKTLVLFLLSIYTKLVSPLAHRLSFFGNHTCRFSPTCSQYTILCVKKYGAFKGLSYGLRQLSNCHSFGFSW